MTSYDRLYYKTRESRLPRGNLTRLWSTTVKPVLSGHPWDPC